MARTLAEDAVVYLFLLALVVLYSGAVGRRTDVSAGGNSAEKVASRFRRYSILLVSYVMLDGALHQLDVIPVLLSVALMVPAAVGLVFGLLWLRKYIPR